MFLQHMLAVLRPGGMVVTVMPHGVLFRGGAEGDIRRKIIEEDLLDTVIGVGPNLFYGTGITAAILVLRAPGAKPPERRDKVLFINADREYEEGRAQNYLQPEHEEKIVAAFRAYEDIDGFARVVSLAELDENDFACHIRRYADNAPPPEPQDVRAHLHGGVPKAEVDTQAAAFARHGIDVTDFFLERQIDVFDEGDAYYWDFAVLDRPIADLVAAKGSAREEELRAEFERLWDKAGPRILALANGTTLAELRAELIELFQEPLAEIGPLDRFQTAGIVARWWDGLRFDIETAWYRGAFGVIDGWLTTIEARQDEKNPPPLTEEPIMRRLVEHDLKERERLAVKVAELDATIKAAEAAKADGGDDEDALGEGELDDDGLTPDQVKRLKQERTRSRKALKALDARLLGSAREARLTLAREEAESMVLNILHEDLSRGFERQVRTHRQHLVSIYQNWHDKYAVTLRELEARRDAATAKLNQYLKDLGYE